MDTEASPASVRSPLWLRFVFGRNPGWTVARILLVIFAAVVVFKFILLPIRVTGNSMYPTYKDGQIKFVNKLAYLRKEPQRGDIVAVEFSGKQILLLKRIVGLPGETFTVFAGEIYINGEKLEEPYAFGKITVAPPGTGLGSTDPIHLGPEDYMVLGDNRPNSDFYIEERDKIVGRVL